MFNYTKLDPEKCDFIDVAGLDDLPAGERFFLEIDGLPIVMFKIGDQFFAIGDICTHDDGPLGDGDLSGYEIHCPRHGASFDVRTGKVLSLPAIVDIPTYPVQIASGRILIGLPKDTP